MVLRIGKGDPQSPLKSSMSTDQAAAPANPELMTNLIYQKKNFLEIVTQLERFFNVQK